MVNIKNVGLISKSITERQKKKKKRNIKFLKKVRYNWNRDTNDPLLGEEKNYRMYTNAILRLNQF